MRKCHVVVFYHGADWVYTGPDANIHNYRVGARNLHHSRGWDGAKKPHRFRLKFNIRAKPGVNIPYYREDDPGVLARRRKRCPTC